MKKLFKQFTELIMSNKGLKVLSLVIAVICWYGIQGITKSESAMQEGIGKNENQSGWRKAITLPVHCLVSKSMGSYKAELNPDQVTVEIESLGSSPSTRIYESMSAFVDCSDISKEGKYRLPVRCVSIQGTRIVDIKPSHVTLELEIHSQRKKKQK